MVLSFGNSILFWKVIVPVVETLVFTTLPNIYDEAFVKIVNGFSLETILPKISVISIAQCPTKIKNDLTDGKNSKQN